MEKRGKGRKSGSCVKSISYIADMEREAWYGEMEEGKKPKGNHFQIHERE